MEREERLFGEIAEEEAHLMEDIEKLAADHNQLKDCVLKTLVQNLSFNPDEVNAETLTSAMKAIDQEEQQDRLWEQRGQKRPAWRPCGWKKIHDSMLRSLVEGRMGTFSNPPEDQVDQSTLDKEIISMGRKLMEDLLFVVNNVKVCYPPEMNICNFYARIYHQTFSARLRKSAGLDCTFLLCWVNMHYPE